MADDRRARSPSWRTLSVSTGTLALRKTLIDLAASGISAGKLNYAKCLKIMIDRAGDLLLSLRRRSSDDRPSSAALDDEDPAIRRASNGDSVDPAGPFSKTLNRLASGQRLSGYRDLDHKSHAPAEFVQARVPVTAG